VSATLHCLTGCAIGEVLGGLLLGLTVFGYFAPAAQSWLFPSAGATPTVLAAVNQLGLLLLLFITGGEYMVIHGGFGLKIAGAGSFALAFVLTIFEALIEFLQAYIFTLLAATYIAGSLADEH